MKTAIDVVGYVNLGLYVLAGAAALRVQRRTGSRAGTWAAATFGSLALVVVVSRVLPSHPHGAAEVIAQRLLIALLVVFPYLLYRFTTVFEEATPRLERLITVLTGLMVVWTFVLPHIPQPGEPRPPGYWAYIAAFLVHWTLLTSVSASRLWRAGHGQPSVAQRRMRLLAVAAVSITIALYVSLAGGSKSVAALVAAFIASISAIAFAAALDPPGWLRTLWRRPEQGQVQDAILDLLRAEDEVEVAARVLPPMARIVGASEIALVGPDGRVLGAHGLDEPTRERVAAGAVDEPNARRIDIDGSTLIVWMNPHAPFFGTEELGLLRTLGAMTAVALDRARLLGSERDALAALERADELKTQFIAFAAHELRTPIASVVGLVETLELREAELRPDLIVELKRTLGEQARRVRSLVEQLLDLSRLDAEAVEIDPEPIAVRNRAEQVIDGLTANREGQIEVAIEPALAAEVDTTAFDQILTNLITNALRYGAAPIIVRATQSDRHFRLVVEDSGPGVPTEFVPQLFERFARSDEARHVEGGTGLGLAIARSYARAHNGDLVYESGSPSGGARFELVLPRRQPAS